MLEARQKGMWRTLRAIFLSENYGVPVVSKEKICDNPSSESLAIPCGPHVGRLQSQAAHKRPTWNRKAFAGWVV